MHHNNVVILYYKETSQLHADIMKLQINIFIQPILTFIYILSINLIYKLLNIHVNMLHIDINM